MSDADIQTLRRQVAENPVDESLIQRLAAAEARTHVDRASRLRRYIGRWVYIEGARMNYLGHLSEVTVTVTGDPAELLFDRLLRVGDWSRSGPQEQYTMELPAEEGLPLWLPWNAVDQFGLAPDGWAPDA